MDGRWCNPKVKLDVGFGGWSSVDFGVVVDEREVLPLFLGAWFHQRFHSGTLCPIPAQVCIIWFRIRPQFFPFCSMRPPIFLSEESHSSSSVRTLRHFPSPDQVSYTVLDKIPSLLEPNAT